jgi:hypothetical protein
MRLKNGNLNNMKWFAATCQNAISELALHTLACPELLKNKFSFDPYTFRSATDNGNLNNMKWLIEKKISI